MWQGAAAGNAGSACEETVPFNAINTGWHWIAGGFGVPNTTISKGKGVAGEWEYVIVPPKVRHFQAQSLQAM
jgi:hypothetical protein